MLTGLRGVLADDSILSFKLELDTATFDMMNCVDGILKGWVNRVGVVVASGNMSRRRSQDLSGFELFDRC